MTAVRTTCPYCGVGCGVIAQRLVTGTIEISGDADHPANLGRLCSKGTALGETLGTEGRLLQPSIRGEIVDWDRALRHVASEFTRIIGQHGPDSIAFYVSGQLLTEDYYVANKLMKGFIGTANIDTNSRLCMSSAVAGHKRAFGEDLVPVCYEDLALADLIVLVGSNTAWCHPVLFQRMLAAKEHRPQVRIVVIDPRRTATCEFADLHLPVRSGTDVWLFNGLLSYLHRHGATHSEFVRHHTTGLSEALQAADDTACDTAKVASICGIQEQQLVEFYELFRSTQRTITAFSQGVNQSSAGTDKVNGIINCHLLTGRIGRPGMGPFSITGQPNAMGGREVGGMANMLAAHMDLDNVAHRNLVQRFWGSPRMAERPGLKAVELFDAIHAGKIKAVWIMATNPAVSLPDADRVREALRKCECVVVSDCVADTDTNRLAHVLLPAAAWGEKEGTVTNSDRHISRQRAFMTPAGQSKPDWWIVSQVAQRMGYVDAFRFENAHEVFVEHAALSGAGNEDSRAFDISGLATTTAESYAAMTPIQWPVPSLGGTARLMSDGRFWHSDRRARFVVTIPRLPVGTVDPEFPLVLNTGRIRDQWHTMTRSGLSPRLTTHTVEPYVDLHPCDARRFSIQHGELARVSSRYGSMVVRARTHDETREGMIFVPIHWSDVFASHGRLGALVNPIVDPISGEPELKHTPVRVQPFSASWHGFALTRDPVQLSDDYWWILVRGEQFLRYELAGTRPIADFPAWAQALFTGSSTHGARGDWLEYSDQAAGIYRGAVIENDRLAAVVFVAPTPNLPERTWLGSLFSRPRLSVADRATLLSGQPSQMNVATGPTVCSCFHIGRQTISAAIQRHGLKTPQEVGKALRAGTNCGSCIPEIKTLLAREVNCVG